MKNSHKYSELFKAKLDNMDLVLLHKHQGWDEWMVEKSATRNDHPNFLVSDMFDYFLCLKEHTEACLHWLNGGHETLEVNSPFTGKFVQCYRLEKWRADGGYMRSDCEYRIRPSEEQLRIAKGKSLYESGRGIQAQLGLGICFAWGDLVDEHQEYWCVLAEAIHYKEKVSK